LAEARKVPWRILADAADEYTEWQVFTLWLRAVLDACEALPAEVALEVEKRSPALLTRVVPQFAENVAPHGLRVWEEVTDWSEANVFAEAKREEWLNAIRYFSSQSLQCKRQTNPSWPACPT